MKRLAPAALAAALVLPLSGCAELAEAMLDVALNELLEDDDDDDWGCGAYSGGGQPQSPGGGPEPASELGSQARRRAQHSN